MEVSRVGSGRWIPLSNVLDLQSTGWPADPTEDVESTIAGEMEPQYYFRVGSRILPMCTMEQYATLRVERKEQDPVEAVDVCMTGTTEWRALKDTVDIETLCLAVARRNLGSSTPKQIDVNAIYFFRAGHQSLPTRSIAEYANDPATKSRTMWKVDVWREGDAGWTPLYKLLGTLDLKQAIVAAKSATPSTPLAALPAPSKEPTTTGLESFAALLLGLGILAGLGLFFAGAVLERWQILAVGIGVICAVVLQHSAITLFCRQCHELHAARKENRWIIDRLSQVKDSPAPSNPS